MWNFCIRCRCPASWCGGCAWGGTVLAPFCPGASVRTSGTRSSSASTARNDSHSLATSYSMPAGQPPAHSRCGFGSGIRCFFDPWIRDPQ